MSTSNQSQIAFENEPDRPTADGRARTTGILPSQEITNLIARGNISATPAINPDHIQPASLDLRLGDMAHRVRASFLPGPNSTVEAKIRELRMTRVDLTAAPVFERDCVYIIPLVEELNLPENISGKANPKSTTGRLDIFTRLITDYGTEFDRVPPGYKGKLYAEVVSRTFTVAIRAGMRLSQLRFVQGNPVSGDRTIKGLDQEESLVYMDDEESPVKARLHRGLRITVNLEAAEAGEVIAYKAKRYAPAIELDRIDYYPTEEFWEVRHQTAKKTLILEPDDFYILASRERVRVPPEFAAEMVPFDPSDGEFRIHYAGFFDPGFGYGSSDIKGTRAVLEVRAHEVPFLIEHGQLVGRLNYMPLLCRPEKIYGTNIGSSYQHQSLTLSKQFRRSER
ncbi:MAG: 2-deoxycytidine 5-triphosphate deaminase [Candidatus Sulfotelmatobacter sp.]|nr:2-deoxycytidine 5-triphosphate deaminase [Candidatus Sulfotelmatobacter sp.]